MPGKLLDVLEDPEFYTTLTRDQRKQAVFAIDPQFRSIPERDLDQLIADRLPAGAEKTGLPGIPLTSARVEYVSPAEPLVRTKKADTIYGPQNPFRKLPGGETVVEGAGATARTLAGGMITGAGGAISALGQGSESLRLFGSAVASVGKTLEDLIFQPDEDGKDFVEDPSKLTDSRYYARLFGNTLGSVMAFAGAGGAAVSASDKALRAARVSDKVRRLGNTAAGTVAGSVLETFIQSGDVFHEAIEHGASPEVAGEIAASTAKRTIGPTLALNALGLYNDTIKRTTRRIAASVLGEIAQEDTQQILTNMAKAEGGLGTPLTEGVAESTLGAAFGGAVGSRLAGGRRGEPAVETAPVAGAEPAKRVRVERRAPERPATPPAIEILAEEEAASRETAAFEDALLAEAKVQPNVQQSAVQAQPKVQQTAAQPAAPAPAAPRQAKVKTARGTVIDTEYAVVDASRLETSHDTALNVNPRYPQERQPRERDRAASEVQISKIAGELDPDELGANYRAEHGAPIVDDSGGRYVVEVGNGRTIALKRLYERRTRNHVLNAAKYRNWLKRKAPEFGIGPEELAAVKDPVLVRVRRTEVDPAEFAAEANEGATAAMSAAEQARQDAGKLTGALMQRFEASDAGELNTAGNRGFIRNFMESVVSPAEQSRYVTAEGAVSQEGLVRIRNAVFARAYGESSAIERLAETPDDNIRNITNGMLRAAPRFASLEEAIDSGSRHDLNISESLTEAASTVSALRESGRKLDDYLDQESLFGRDPVKYMLLDTFRKHGRSGKRISEVLGAYADAVEALGDPRQQGIFSTSKPSRAEVLNAAITFVEARYAKEQQAGAPDQAPPGAQNPAGDAGTVPGQVRGARPAAPGRPGVPAADQARPVSRLPRELAGANPRYSFGAKQFEVQFSDDLDKAAYIAAQSKRSKRDADYVRFVAGETGLSSSAIRALGVKVRGRIYTLARTAEPGTLKVPPVIRELLPESRQPGGIERAADAARQRIEKRGTLKGEKLNAGLPVEDMADLAIIGAAKIARGAKTFAAWSREMVADFGERVRRSLLKLWREAKKLGADESGAFRTGRLFGDDVEAGLREDAKTDARRLEGARLTAEFKSPLNRGNLRRPLKKGAGPAQTDLFEATPEEPQMGLFGSERGAVTISGETVEGIRKKAADARDFLAPAGSVVGRQGAAGAQLKRLIDRAFDEGEVRAGKRVAKLMRAGLHKLSREQRFELLDALEGRTDYVAEGVAGVHDATREVLDDLAAEAVAKDVQVKFRHTIWPGEERPAGLLAFHHARLDQGKPVTVPAKRAFVARRDYFPHVIPRPEALKEKLRKNPVREDVVDNLVRLGLRKKRENAAAFLDNYIEFIETGRNQASLVEYMIRSGQAKNKGEALLKLHRYRQRTIKREGSLEFAREIDLPFYDPDPLRVLPGMAARSSLRLAQIGYFGQENDRVNELVAEIRAAGGDADQTRVIVDRILSLINEPDLPGARWGRVFRTIQGFKLGLAAIPNMTQGALNTLLAGDLRAAVAGVKGAASKQGRELAMESGAALESVLNETMRQAGGGWKYLDTFLRATQFSSTERLNRIVAANGGLNYAQRQLDRLKRDATNSRARKVLEELGLDVDAVVARGRLEGDDVLMAAKKFSDLTQFRSRPQDLPLFASSEAGKVIFQFKSFIYGQTRLLHREVMSEFAARRFGRATRSLLVLMTVFPIAGELVKSLRGLITGRDRKEVENFSDLVKRYLDDIAAVGTMGVLGDLLEAGRIQKGTEALVGPTLGELGSALDAAASADPRKWARFAYRRIPIVGPRVAELLAPPKNRR